MGDAGRGAAEHGAGADLLETEQAKKLAEAGDLPHQARFQHGDGVIAPGDSRAAGGHNDVNIPARQQRVKERGDRGRIVGEDVLIDDGVPVVNEQLADALAGGVGGGGAGIAERDDHNASGGLLGVGGGLMLLIGHD